jgi:hypothetical protein
VWTSQQHLISCRYLFFKPRSSFASSCFCSHRCLDRRQFKEERDETLFCYGITVTLDHCSSLTFHQPLICNYMLNNPVKPIIPVPFARKSCRNNRTSFHRRIDQKSLLYQLFLYCANSAKSWQISSHIPSGGCFESQHVKMERQEALSSETVKSVVNSCAHPFSLNHRALNG